MLNVATTAADVFSILVESVSEGVLILSPDGTIEYCNSSFASMAGSDPERLTGEPLRDHVSPVHRGKLLRMLAQANKGPCREELTLMGADLRGVPAQIAMRPAVHGGRKGICAVVTDLSWVDAAREARLSLAAIVEASTDAIVSETPEGRILSWNRGAELLYGYSSEEMIGASIRKVVPAERQEELDGFLQRIKQGEATQDFETVHQRKDGSLVDISLSISPLRDRLGRITAACTIAHDITASKRARRRVQCVLESAPDSMVVFNNRGEIVLVNTATEKVFGYRRDQLIGQSVEMLVPERIRRRRLALSRRPAQYPGRLSMRGRRSLTLCKANGEEFPAEVSLGMVEEGQTPLVCGLIRDVTEHLMLEEALRVKNVQLEEAIRGKDRFLAAMSHELRTPLNGIIGVTGLLLMKLSGPLTAEQKRQLEIVRTSAKHLLSIINDLLDLAMISSGKTDVHLEPVRCGEVIEEVAAALQPMAAEKKLALTVNRPAVVGTVRTNRRFLRQILFNLTSNAVKYTEAGSVTLSVCRACDAGRQVVRFVVADTGIGIPAEDRPRIFEEFARLTKEDGVRREGVGLGLHLSQKLASLLGGEITVESEPGKGSNFTLTLPWTEIEGAAG